ncbi:MAG: hypothetical protein IH623_03720 [Verrucomicrobia bacterium]|nr:hypothetical protein [Verrucomicrobiota bacterium]
MGIADQVARLSPQPIPNSYASATQSLWISSQSPVVRRFRLPLLGALERYGFFVGGLLNALFQTDHSSIIYYWNVVIAVIQGKFLP